MSTKQALAFPSREQPTGSRSKRHQPTNAEIAKRAYEIFLLRGSSHGSDLDDWLQAERELRAKN